MLQTVKEDEVLERLCGLGRRRSFLTSLRVLFLCGEVSSGVGGKFKMSRILRDKPKNGQREFCSKSQRRGLMRTRRVNL